MTALPTRRTVLRTAVWTVPAVSVVVAAPAFAVSVGATTGIAYVGGSLTRTRYDASGWLLEVFLEVTPATALPTFSYSLAGGPVATFQGVDPRQDWGPGTYQCYADGLEGSWSRGQTVSATFFVAGLSTVATIDVYDDWDGSTGIPGGGDDWGI
ncbi:hypothetical protein [Nocardioides zeae]|uniref:Uncharacterized protein n=1 Tax=Nocardioides zeae TaxID=1457234 RepID=A0AAJ1X1J3_9ACTN|nr:hypothetical protein [Nocardioides zeae]MDQ1104961.1 hypothetical protein [Nocardioides zeae]